MNNTRIEYIKRLHEVEVYFDTLKLLDNGNCSIKCVDILGVETIKKIDSELSMILKANGYFTPYNINWHLGTPPFLFSWHYSSAR